MEDLKRIELSETQRVDIAKLAVEKAEDFATYCSVNNIPLTNESLCLYIFSIAAKFAITADQFKVLATMFTIVCAKYTKYREDQGETKPSES